MRRRRRRGRRRRRDVAWPQFGRRLGQREHDEAEHDERQEEPPEEQLASLRAPGAIWLRARSRLILWAIVALELPLRVVETLLFGEIHRRWRVANPWRVVKVGCYHQGMGTQRPITSPIARPGRKYVSGIIYLVLVATLGLAIVGLRWLVAR